MITIDLMDVERTITLQANEDYVIKGVRSFQNLHTVTMRWSIKPITEDNKGGRIGEDGERQFSRTRNLFIAKSYEQRKIHVRSIKL